MEILLRGKYLWSLQYAVNLCIKLHLTELIGKLLTHKLKLGGKKVGREIICVHMYSFLFV